MIKFLEEKRAYYDDPENVVVEYSLSGVEWSVCNSEPGWHPEYKYRIRPRTIRIGEIDVPEPVWEALTVGQKYFIASPDFQGYFYADTWDGDTADARWLARGLIHLTKEAAIEHAKALIIVSGGKV